MSAVTVRRRKQAAPVAEPLSLDRLSESEIAALVVTDKVPLDVAWEEIRRRDRTRQAML